MTDKTDRELLELAAKAAGITKTDGVLWYTDDGDIWEPLESDGDALKLAVKRRFTIKIADHEVEIFDEDYGCLTSIPMFRPTEEEVQKTVRRAIVRAAAIRAEEK